jgi:hypothetical protein
MLLDARALGETEGRRRRHEQGIQLSLALPSPEYLEDEHLR